MSTESSELAIIRAVQQLDEKLSKALTAQTQTLTRSIQQLADRQSSSLLEQEKRNATFADRDRVEAVAEHSHQNANHIQSLLFRVTESEKRIVELAAEIKTFQSSVAERAVGFLAGANGYLLTFITLVLVAIIAAAIARLLR